ncbi:MAG: hypothetical protein JSW01_03510 [Candidatus Bathyarchaeota archaeon]|nr:MAG: hypothetical protein JSW01_03510 [Candidatus Bathyarchaeota archaeon]
MTDTLILVGSPRGKKSSSTSLGNHLKSLLQDRGLEVEMLWIKLQLVTEEKTSLMLEAISDAEAVIMIAPLYDDCQPYIVTKTMELIAAQELDVKKRRFLPIINCGFPESSHITAVAIPIYKKFASKIGYDWAGSLALGGGEMLQGRYGKQLDDIGGLGDKARRELEKIADVLAGGIVYSDEALVVMPDIFLKPILADLIRWMNNRMWRSQAEKHGAAVDARPYAP